MNPMKRISKSELTTIVADYHLLFPGWEQISPDAIARADGPVMQCIGFESLRGGTYRPMHFLRPLVTPEICAGFFHQFLQKWPSELLPRQHHEYHRRMSENMKLEFTPSTTEDLDAWKVLDLCEKKAIPKSFEAYGLAALNAYFGRDDRARYWCWSYPKLVDALGYAWEPWQLNEKNFLDSLLGWLETGEAKLRLQEILRERRKQEGFK